MAGCVERLGALGTSVHPVSSLGPPPTANQVFAFSPVFSSPEFSGALIIYFVSNTSEGKFGNSLPVLCPLFFKFPRLD